MRIGVEIGPVEHAVELAVDDGDGDGRLVVDLGGEHAEVAPFANGLALRVQPFEADIIHLHRAVDDRAAAGFGDFHQVGFQGEMAHFRRQGVEPLGFALALLQAEQAAFRPGDDRKAFLARGVVEPVIDHAHEDEIAVPQPLQKGHGFLAFRRQISGPVRLRFAGWRRAWGGNLPPRWRTAAITSRMPSMSDSGVVGLLIGGSSARMLGLLLNGELRFPLCGKLRFARGSFLHLLQGALRVARKASGWGGARGWRAFAGAAARPSASPPGRACRH